MNQQSTPSKDPWSDIPRRLSTICIGVPILWIIWSCTTTRLLFFNGVHLAVSYEWTVMTNMHRQVKFWWLFPVISLLLINTTNDGSFVVGLVFFVSCTSILLDQKIILPVLQSVFLITIPFRTWLAIAGGINGFFRTVSLLLTVWNCDTGALLTGRLFGKKATTASSIRYIHKFRTWLATISPQKSMEGLMGGLFLGAFTYVGLPWFWRVIVNWNLAPSNSIDVSEGGNFSVQDVMVGIILALSALVGDLWESTMKRQYAVKDSGKLLPGHGGVLDRFDSSLVASMAYFAIFILQKE